jgi:hypothetical protein
MIATRSRNRSGRKVPTSTPSHLTAPAAGLVQASHHLGQRGLARTVLAYQGDHLTLVDLDAGRLQGQRTTSGIGESHRIGSDPPEVCRWRDGARAAFGCRRQGEEAVQIIDELPRFKDRLYAAEAGLDLTGQQPDRD